MLSLVFLSHGFLMLVLGTFTFEALGVISTFMSCPSSSLRGL
jgi:hypothetical protein